MDLVELDPSLILEEVGDVLSFLRWEHMVLLAAVVLQFVLFCNLLPIASKQKQSAWAWEDWEHGEDQVEEKLKVESTSQKNVELWKPPTPQVDPPTADSSGPDLQSTSTRSGDEDSDFHAESHAEEEEARVPEPMTPTKLAILLEAMEAYASGGLSEEQAELLQRIVKTATGLLEVRLSTSPKNGQTAESILPPEDLPIEEVVAVKEVKGEECQTEVKLTSHQRDSNEEHMTSAQRRSLVPDDEPDWKRTPGACGSRDHPQKPLQAEASAGSKSSSASTLQRFHSVQGHPPENIDGKKQAYKVGDACEVKDENLRDWVEGKITKVEEDKFTVKVDTVDSAAQRFITTRTSHMRPLSPKVEEGTVNRENKANCLSSADAVSAHHPKLVGSEQGRDTPTTVIVHHFHGPRQSEPLTLPSYQALLPTPPKPYVLPSSFHSRSDARPSTVKVTVLQPAKLSQADPLSHQALPATDRATLDTEYKSQEGAEPRESTRSAPVSPPVPQVEPDDDDDDYEGPPTLEALNNQTKWPPFKEGGKQRGAFAGQTIGTAVDTAVETAIRVPTGGTVKTLLGMAGEALGGWIGLKVGQYWHPCEETTCRVCNAVYQTSHTDQADKYYGFCATCKPRSPRSSQQ